MQAPPYPVLCPGATVKQDGCGYGYRSKLWSKLWLYEPHCEKASSDLCYN